MRTRAALFTTTNRAKNGEEHVQGGGWSAYHNRGKRKWNVAQASSRFVFGPAGFVECGEVAVGFVMVVVCWCGVFCCRFCCCGVRCLGMVLVVAVGVAVFVNVVDDVAWTSFVS